jgi:membrane protease YdiL (CAAX protease family)
MNRKTIAWIALALLVLVSTLPNLGVIIGWLFLIVTLLVCVRQGSFAEIGFRRPMSWRRTLLQGLGIGVGLQLAFSILIDPLIERLTGIPLDLSSLDGMRGNLASYLVILALGWLVGGFLEEMLFRGYLLKRLQIVVGDSSRANAIAVMLPALAFGLAHSYQGASGMISTGLFGAILGVIFVSATGNLWLPVLVHGFSNTLGITLIYTNGDKVLSSLLFP